MKNNHRRTLHAVRTIIYTLYAQMKSGAITLLFNTAFARHVASSGVAPVMPPPTTTQFPLNYYHRCNDTITQCVGAVVKLHNTIYYIFMYHRVCAVH